MKKQFLILMRICFVAALIISCNKSDNQIGGKDRNITWKINDEGVLTISGKGSMPNYGDNFTVPWAEYRNSIAAIVIEDGITRIGNWAFSYCHGLIENLTLPKSLKYIGDNAFFYSYGITGNLILPEGLISIGNEAFEGCIGFTGNLVLPEGIKSISYYAFNGCSGFTGSLVLPEGIRSIIDFAFNGCGFTGNLIIPKGINLGNWVFGSCRGFSSLTIPEDMEDFAVGAFTYCTGLADIINCSVEPQNNADLGFTGVPISNITLHVPSISLAKYKRDSFWGKFGSIVTIENSNNNN